MIERILTRLFGPPGSALPENITDHVDRLRLTLPPRL